MKMKLVPALLLFGVLLAEADFSVSTMGVKVTKEGYGKNQYGGTELAPFNGQGKPATEIALLVTSDGRKILKLDEKKSKFTSVKDDQGGDLLTGKTFMGKSYDFVFPKTSEDGKALLATMAFPVLPKKGSTKIEMEGELHVTTGAATMNFKAADVAMKKGTKFKLGEIEFEIEEVGQSNFGDNAYEFTLKTNEPLDHVQEFSFLDGSGEKVEASRSGSSSMGGFLGGKGTYTISFRTKKKLEIATVAGEIYTDFKNETIAVKQVVSLGL